MTDKHLETLRELSKSYFGSAVREALEEAIKLLEWFGVEWLSNMQAKGQAINDRINAQVRLRPDMLVSPRSAIQPYLDAIKESKGQAPDEPTVIE